MSWDLFRATVVLAVLIVSIPAVAAVVDFWMSDRRRRKGISGAYCAMRGGNPGDRLIEGLLEELVAPKECAAREKRIRTRAYRESTCPTCGQPIQRRDDMA